MPEAITYPRLSRFKDPAAFRGRLAELNLELPLDDEILSAEEGSPMAQPAKVYGKTVSNRWCIHPMEGWDGTPDGKPTEHTIRRWKNFGASGAKLIFGCEAVAVRHDGRANPNQLCHKPENVDGFAELHRALIGAHKEHYGTAEDLSVGLQLTHSGRFCRPDMDKKLKPRTLYRHPVLDRKFGIDPSDESVILRDGEIDEIIRCYIDTAKMAAEVGFDFVDVKHCHGYLGHEFLSAYTRPGKYGGSFENRTRFLRAIVEGIRAEVPGLSIAVRLSLFDFVPYCDDEGTRSGRQKGVGIPEPFDNALPYQYGFGVNADNPLEYDLTEPAQFIELLKSLDITLVNLTCGSPYYNPHIQRPAYFPPSDGYRPPEDPLVGVVRQIQAAREIKAQFSGLQLIGTAYSYLQEFLPLVAQAVVRDGWIDFVGIGRGVLSYPTMPADTLQKKPMDRKAICRTFSDCTTAPRNGMISGCFPLDAYYKQMPEMERLKELKAEAEQK